MGLFGLHLKDLEAIPSDIVGGVEHLFGDNQAPSQNAPQPNSNNFRPPQQNFQQNNNGPGFMGGNGQQAMNMLQAQNQNNQQYTPPGMKRDQFGKLIPVNGNTGPANDPLANFVNRYAVKPIKFVGGNAVGVPVNAAKTIVADAFGNKTASQNARNAENNNINNLVTVGRSFTRPIGEAVMSVDPKQVTYDPQQSPVAKALFGSKPMQNIEKKTVSNYEAHSYLPAWQRIPLAGGEAVGSVAQVLPGVGLVAKGVKLAADFAEAASKIAALKDLGNKAFTPDPAPPEAFPTSADPQAALKQEALKYGSADEFVKAQANGKTPIFTETQQGAHGSYTGTGADFAKGTGTINVGKHGDNTTLIHEVAHQRYEALPQEHQGVLDYALKEFNDKNPGAFSTTNDPAENIALAAEDYLGNKRTYGSKFTNELNKTTNGRLLQDFFKQNADAAANGTAKIPYSKQQLTDLYNQAHAEAKTPGTPDTTRSPELQAQEGMQNSLNPEFGKLQINEATSKIAALKDLGNKAFTPDPAAIQARAAQLDKTVNAVRDLPNNTAKAAGTLVQGGSKKITDAAKAVVDNYNAYGTPKEGFPSAQRTATNLNDIPKIAPPPQAVGAPIAGEVPKAATSMPEVNKALDDVAQEHATATDFTAARDKGDVNHLTDITSGVTMVGQRVANALRKALKDNLTSDEQTQVTKLLDGQTVPATPRAVEVATEARKLHDQGIQIRQAIKPDVGKVTNYVPRYIVNEARSAVKGAVSQGAKSLGKVKNFADIFDQNSMSSIRREDGKFVAADGTTIYGSPKNLQLTGHNDGTFTDKDGKEFSRRQVSNTELEANTNKTYQWNYSQIAGRHHADTLSLKARAEALQELMNNREKYGLHTQEEIENGALEGKEISPVNRVEEFDKKDAAGNTPPRLFATAKDAKTINDRFGYSKHTNLAAKIAGKAIDIPTHIATQFIVLNPFFHGMNQLYQTAIAAGNLPEGLTGWGKTAVGVAKVTEDDVRDYLRAGGHSPTYGADKANWLSKMTLGLTKVNSSTMHGIELRLRTGLFKASKDAGMSDAEAIANIDRFLGDASHMGPAAQRTLLFAHYFKTMSGAQGNQIIHPVENAGASVNTVLLSAITAAVSQGYKEFTGNPNAYARIPGEIGLAEQGYKFGKDVATGNYKAALGEASNRFNPVVKEAVQQATNHDFFTGGKVSDTAPVKVGGVRLNAQASHLLNSTVAPAQVVERGAQGKRSAAEIVANQLGINTPHAKGYQAAPSGNANILNTKDSIKANEGDPTYYQQQQAYFKGVDALKQQFSGDKRSSDALNDFLDRNHDPNTGQTYQLSPADRIEISGKLATNDKLRDAVQHFELSQPTHDPKWDLPKDQLAFKMTYDAMPEGSPERAFMKQEADTSNGQNWLTNLTKQENDYYNSLQKPPGYQPPIATGPKFPLDDNAQALLDKYDTASVDQRDNMIKDPTIGPELALAWNSLAKWTNQVRQAQTGKDTPVFKLYPTASPQVENIMKEYNALPKGDGKLGGSPERAQWIQSHPQEYAQMQDFLTKSTMYTMEKDASVDRFQGATASQQELKDIKSLGQYDIGARKNADGTTSYSLGTAPGYTTGSSSSFTKSGSETAYQKLKAETKLTSQARDIKNSAKAADRGVIAVIRKGNLHGPRRMSVSMKGQTKVRQYRVKSATLKARQIAKVAPAKAPSLANRNHVKLKA